MLILNRRRGEAIVLDGGIRVVVLECDRGGARLGIEAPRETNIQREELLARVAAENQRARAGTDQAWVTALPVQGGPMASTSRRRRDGDRHADRGS